MKITTDTLDQRLTRDGWTVTESGCWEFNGSRNKRHGYGYIGIGGITLGAHRAAYLAWVGPIPEGMHVLHSCDNRPCINPHHLRVGTAKDNAQDTVTRGRMNHPRDRNYQRLETP